MSIGERVAARSSYSITDGSDFPDRQPDARPRTSLRVPVVPKNGAAQVLEFWGCAPDAELVSVTEDLSKLSINEV